MNSEPDRDAYEAGLRAGYAHGYDVGRAHGRAEAEVDHVDLPPVRLAGPDRAELIARGHIPIDRTRPPALPVRLWDAADWAKADVRDLPTTEVGHEQWRDAIAAGRVPAELADAFARATSCAEADVGGVGGSLASTDRALAAIRVRLAGRAATPDDHDPDPAGRAVEATTRDRGIAR